MAPRPACVIPSGRISLALKLCFVVFAFCVCLHVAVSLLPEAWRMSRKAVPVVEGQEQAAALQAAERLWTSYERKPHALRHLCGAMSEEEFTMLCERLANVGLPSFDKALVWRETSSPGLYHVDIPVNGGTLSLIACERNGILTVSNFVGLNLN